MKKKQKKKIHKTKHVKTTKKLRTGSKAFKKILLANDPHCDICGCDKSLQLHHIYLIRHGFPTQFDRVCLLCPTCHCEFHQRWDKYLDEVFNENPNADFLEIYNRLKKL